MSAMELNPERSTPFLEVTYLNTKHTNYILGQYTYIYKPT